MKNRFNLEEEISHLYVFADQLATLSEGVLEHDLDKDEIANVLEGMRVMMNLHAQKMHDTMTQCFKLDQYRDYKDIV
jgi:hypothetical protein